MFELLQIPSLLTSGIHHQFVHPPGPQSGSDSLSNNLGRKQQSAGLKGSTVYVVNSLVDVPPYLAGIDVTDELGNALRRICPLLQQDNRCGLQDTG